MELVYQKSILGKYKIEIISSSMGELTTSEEEVRSMMSLSSVLPDSRSEDILTDNFEPWMLVAQSGKFIFEKEVSKVWFNMLIRAISVESGLI